MLLSLPFFQVLLSVFPSGHYITIWVFQILLQPVLSYLRNALTRPCLASLPPTKLPRQLQHWRGWGTRRRRRKTTVVPGRNRPPISGKPSSSWKCWDRKSWGWAVRELGCLLGKLSPWNSLPVALRNLGRVIALGSEQ